MKSPEEKLFDMIGKDWLYHSKNIRILGVFQRDEIFRIKAESPEGTNEDIDLHAQDVKQFVKDCLIVDMTPTVVEKAKDENTELAMAIVKNSNLDINDLTQTLLDNIEKVRENPEYINQAKAVTNNVNSILNLKRLQFQVAKELKRK
ncbi:hypothetical protein C7460_10498 [Marinoscillum furvescens DSM 4134]|uniref:Uncharacterized protein n=2 Tax=Marinoscillum furvescens TaxID=1026 RepID=A0A3D9L6V2_MARFU|nr:hypothetical protein C7460_10498 [Marinoscillum furvescens DSM 4134]